MKVVKPGKKNWPKTVICKNPPHMYYENGCGAILEIEKKDLKTGWFGANYGGETPDKKEYASCPECGKEIFRDWM